MRIQKRAEAFYSLAMDTAAILAAAGGVQKVPSPKLSLFIKRGFLSPEECTGIIALIDSKRRPSTIADSNGDDAFRTSETCDLDRAYPEVAALEAKITALTGIDPRYGEPIQGQRYAVGQEFKPHTDTFEPGGAAFFEHCVETGQRTWTAMIYLNRPEDGGATRFKTIGKTVQADTGKLLAWNNLLPNGSPNPATLHQGMKVRRGAKYVLTKWFRERAAG
jgi:prolyl 4-hydroxylase